MSSLKSLLKKTYITTLDNNLFQNIFKHIINKIFKNNSGCYTNNRNLLSNDVNHLTQINYINYLNKKLFDTLININNDDVQIVINHINKVTKILIDKIFKWLNNNYDKTELNTYDTELYELLHIASIKEKQCLYLFQFDKYNEILQELKKHNISETNHVYILRNIHIFFDGLCCFEKKNPEHCITHNNSGFCNNMQNEINIIETSNILQKYDNLLKDIKTEINNALNNKNTIQKLCNMLDPFNYTEIEDYAIFQNAINNIAKNTKEIIDNFYKKLMSDIYSISNYAKKQEKIKEEQAIQQRNRGYRYQSEQFQFFNPKIDKNINNINISMITNKYQHQEIQEYLETQYNIKSHYTTIFTNHFMHFLNQNTLLPEVNEGNTKDILSKLNPTLVNSSDYLNYVKQIFKISLNKEFDDIYELLYFTNLLIN
jgi:hypothetical protein